MKDHLWEAQWIWGAGEDSPRNAWLRFRRAFVPSGGVAGAKLRVTADSRYVLFVNGVRVGRGPVRSWPFELPYDEYEVGHLLEEGKEAVIAVLVTHYGVSTFQYLRGRGGLLLELDGVCDQDGQRIKTDHTWKTTPHPSFARHASRISCQLPFTEIYDADAGDEGWTTASAGFDDRGWQNAHVVGPVGTAPWTNVVPRPIPYLTEEPVHPARVEALRFVRPPAWSAAIDVRTAMMPDSADHANHVSFTGLLATTVVLANDAKLTIGVVDSGQLPVSVIVDGRPVPKSSYYGDDHPERYVDIDLSVGEHLILFDVTSASHGLAFHLGFDAGGASFDVRSPLPATASNPEAQCSPFLAVGPFDARMHLDHQPPVPSADRNHPDYLRALAVDGVASLSELDAWVRPIAAELVNLNGVFTDQVWTPVAVSQPVPIQLQQAVLPTADPAVLPVAETSGLDTEIVIDFGRELSGFVAFELDAAAGTVVDFYGYEYRKDGWTQHMYGVDNTLRYRCREGRQSYVSYVRRGLRYLTLTVRGASRPVRLYRVYLLQSNFPVADVGRFRCSDALLNDIWAISRDTTRLCMEDTFVDCPTFEQTYWVGDARNEALVNYYTFGSKDIVEHCLRLVPGSSFQTPLLADQVPSGWSSVIPNWTFFWIAACREYYEFNGDLAFVKDLWPHVQRTLRAFEEQLNEDGLIDRTGWNLLDWAPFEQPGAGIVTHQNMFFAKAMRDGAALAELAGDSEGAGRLRDKADRLAAAIDARLWDEARQAYVDCIHTDGRLSATTSMQTQIVAYLCDIAGSERRSVIERYLVSPPESFVQAGSPFMSFFYYEAFARLGRFDLMLSDMRRNYGIMVEHEATSCWEMYPWSDFNQRSKVLTRSHCHAWSAGPAYFLGAHVLGVSGAAPGWTKVRVAPQPSGLQWANGAVPLPQGGRVDVSWRVLDERILRLRVEAPAGVELDIVPPDGMTLELERATIG